MEGLGPGRLRGCIWGLFRLSERKFTKPSGQDFEFFGFVERVRLHLVETRTAPLGISLPESKPAFAVVAHHLESTATASEVGQPVAEELRMIFKHEDLAPGFVERCIQRGLVHGVGA